MKRTILTTVVALLFGLAPAVWARDDRDFDRDRQGGVTVGIPDSGYSYGAHFNEVQVLAHRLANTAAIAYRLAEAQSHRFDRMERRVVERLDKLDEAAQHFHAMTEQYDQDPEHTERDFRRLMWAFRRADRAMERMHGSDDVSRVFDDVRSNMDELVRYYGGYGAYDRVEEPED
jgi:choline dehydrogenase-like flavoprotein